MQYPENTGVAVQTGEHTYQTKGFHEKGHEIEKTIFVDARAIGTITVRYLNKSADEDEHPFMPEEISLLKIISERIGDYLSRRSTEVRLRESEEKFRELFNNMSSGVAVYDPCGQVTS